ncbi:hypothetical protein ACFQ80_10880 [Isoptericola sp. NPDC056578]|uniref:hypothetical protein n=1 Tax=Isoptericola sp. NPDC056578 TaxID=3345870 RepID=UPI00368E2C33
MTTDKSSTFYCKCSHGRHVHGPTGNGPCRSCSCDTFEPGPVPPGLDPPTWPLPDAPPPDAVPARPLTRDDLLDLNARVGHVVTVSQPGAVMLDPDGMPVGVEPSTSWAPEPMERPSFTLAEVRAAGVTPGEIPNIDVVDTGDVSD